MNDAFPTPPEGWPGEVDWNAPVKAWHVYQQHNGLWTVTSEDTNGRLAIRAYNVPTEQEAIRHEAEKMRANDGHGGEIVAEHPKRDPQDPVRIEPYDFEPPRRAGE